MDCDRPPPSIRGEKGRNYGPNSHTPVSQTRNGTLTREWAELLPRTSFFLKKKVGSFIFWGGNCGGRMAGKGCWVDRFNYYWTQIPFFLSSPRKRNSHLRKKEGGGEKNVKVEKKPKIGYFWARHFFWKARIVIGLGETRQKSNLFYPHSFLSTSFWNIPQSPITFATFPSLAGRAEKNLLNFPVFSSYLCVCETMVGQRNFCLFFRDSKRNGRGQYFFLIFSPPIQNFDTGLKVPPPNGKYRSPLKNRNRFDLFPENLSKMSPEVWLCICLVFSLSPPKKKARKKSIEHFRKKPVSWGS